MTQIFYFTGTGTSLFIAKDLANSLNASVIPIGPLQEKPTVPITADTVGIVFPTYHASYGYKGLPFIVESFLNRLTGLEGKQIFLIVTHSGMPWATIGNAAEIISERGGTVSIGVTIQLDVPHSIPSKLSHILFKTPLKSDVPRDEETIQKRIKQWNVKKEKLLVAIRENSSLPLETPSPGKERFLTPLINATRPPAEKRYHKLSKISTGSFEEISRHADRSFTTNASCEQCGICVKVCPVNNITLNETGPVWNGNCENCNACFNWCPSEAITGEIVEYTKRIRYPGITLSDMIQNKDTYHENL